MTEPLQQIASAGLAEQINCDQLAEVMLALKTQIVFCDLPSGEGIQENKRKDIPVRNVRRYTPENKPKDLARTDPQFTERDFLGRSKGFEVQTLEGWSIPERVYYVVRKAAK
jgi:hypothetical protein